MPRIPLNRSPRFVAAFVVCLAGVQVLALGRQFSRGFRPFGQKSHRVPLSWDMFANRVERCTLEWGAPVPSPYGPFSRLREMGAPLEWDMGYDHVIDYKAAARVVCFLGGKNIHFKLHCWTPDGGENREAFGCGR